MTKKIFKLLRNYIYLLFIRLIKVPHPQKQYYAAICAIFKNEARYLQEWIEYHRLIGIEHFYLYNNCSTDNYQDILQPYIKSGIVTLTDWPHPKAQMPVYNHCLKIHQKDVSWLGFIDLDEFIVLNHYKNIGIWLQKHRRLPMALIYWKIFSSNGVFSEKKNALVTETYILSAPMSNIQKMFFNTNWYSFIKIFHIPHIAKLKFFGTFVSDHPLLYYGFQKHRKTADIQLNHYYNKSYQYQKNKKIPNGLADKDGLRNMDLFFDYENICRSPDYNIFSRLIELKLAIKNTSKDAK